MRRDRRVVVERARGLAIAGGARQEEVASCDGESGERALVVAGWADRWARAFDLTAAEAPRGAGG